MEEGLGWKFWLATVGVIIGLGAAGLVFISLLGAVTATWGFLGALLFAFAAIAVVAYVVDRRRA